MPDQQRSRILVADDREENRYVLCRVLRGAGYECLEAGTGAKALEFAETHPDLIILDVRLPDMSGYHVCRALKQNPHTASIPILQISASFVASEDRVRALDAGADGYLTHPIDRMVLVATVRALLRLRVAEATARTSALQWETTFNTLSEGLAILDADNRLSRWNDAFESICGAAFQPQAGKDPVAFFADAAGRENLLNGRERYSGEIAVADRTVQLSVSKIGADADKQEKVLVVSDITDRKLAEYALRTAEKLAATGKLANAIAHEINNPLEAVVNLIYLAQASEDLPAIREHLATAATELDRIARITRQTLAFHRDTQTPVAVDVSTLLGDVIGLYETVAAGKRVKVVFDAQPSPLVNGYPGQLTQVFGNLVRNALEASPSGSAVAVRVRPIQRGGVAGIRVMIHDRGPGIPQCAKEKLFDPFFTTKDLKGSGLGLWVSRRLIARHRGHIRFRSSEREGRSGATFEVFLPSGKTPLD
ncbi:MAG TPA: ATP-binding protein [Terracidiphilus sp.]|nr:ATP-binding protein [Terracidiphilus sp.]